MFSKFVHYLFRPSDNSSSSYWKGRQRECRRQKERDTTSSRSFRGYIDKCICIRYFLIHFRFFSALSSGCENAIRPLIELGANLFAENSYNETPRDLAIKNREISLFCSKNLIKIRQIIIISFHCRIHGSGPTSEGSRRETKILV